jgi:peptide/nickel transport system permease protein
MAVRTAARPRLRLVGLRRAAAPIGEARGIGRWMFWSGVAITIVFVVLAIFPSEIAPYGFDQYRSDGKRFPQLAHPSGSHVFGTTVQSTDVASRVVWGARTELEVVLLALVAALVIGVPLGLLSGYVSGWLDRVLVLFMDALFAFPYLLLAIAVMALFKPSLLNLIIVLALRSWVVYARTVRSLTMSTRQREFVEAAVAAGASDLRIVFRHVMPNVLAPVIVISSFQLAELIIVESSLSFLGLGVQPPTPTWGGMLSQGREYITSAWWLAVFPGLGIVLTVLGTNLLGDGLRDALDPRLRL